MYCNKCGNQLPDDSCFCNRCGNQLQPMCSTSEQPEEINVYDVILTFPGIHKEEVIRFIKSNKNITLQEAQSIVNNTPVLISGKLDYAEAELLRSTLEKLGAKADVSVTPAERFYYQDEFERLVQDYSNLTPDCIASLEKRNQFISIIIECNKALYTGGALSSLANIAFMKKTKDRYKEIAPQADAEIERSQKELEKAVSELNKKYGNMYFVHSPTEVAKEMATNIYKYVNSFTKIGKML